MPMVTVARRPRELQPVAPLGYLPLKSLEEQPVYAISSNLSKGPGAVPRVFGTGIAGKSKASSHFWPVYGNALPFVAMV